MTIVYAMRCVSKPREQVYSPLFCMEGSGSPRGERDEGGGRGKFRGVGLEGEGGKGRDRWGLGWEVWKRERGPRRGNFKGWISLNSVTIQIWPLTSFFNKMLSVMTTMGSLVRLPTSYIEVGCLVWQLDLVSSWQGNNPQAWD